MKSKTLKYALITGGSGGLGEEFAKLAAKDNYNLILIGRRKEELEKVKNYVEKTYGIFAHVIVKDLSLYDSVFDIYQELRLLKITPEIIINNAGFGLYGSFNTTEWGKEYQMMELNIVALTHLIKKLLPHMLEKGYGRILNVASVAAYLPGPYMAVYYASKAYVLSLSHALNTELKGTGVSVTALCPGPTKTEFETNANFNFSTLKFVKVSKAQVVAEAGYKAMLNGKANTIPGFDNRLLVGLISFMPKRLVSSLMKYLQGPK